MEHKHSHHHDCCCDGTDHTHHQLPFGRRWLLSILIVSSLLFLLHSFILEQMYVRLTSYASYSMNQDVIRICQKMILLDKANIKAWTSLGYAYVDEKQTKQAIQAFETALKLNPEGKAASFELGKIYFAKKDYLNAIVYFENIRLAGEKVGVKLNADILKYRHGKKGLRSLRSMEELLLMLSQAYHMTGHQDQAIKLQQEYESYKLKNKSKLFF